MAARAGARMMDYFGRLADDLVEIIEDLERPAYAGDSEALRRTLAKAVEEANIACRARRKRQEALGDDPSSQGR